MRYKERGHLVELKGKLSVLGAIALVGMLGTATNSYAVIVSGSTIVGFGSNADATINYAVIAPTDPGYLGLFGTLSAAFAPGVVFPGPVISPPLVIGEFIYLYQAANDDDVTLHQLSAHSNSLGGPRDSHFFSPSSWGAFTGLVMTDEGNADSFVCGGTSEL